ncbi:MAG: hypothetical protein KF802_05420 [Bdellovibrionaceae bacterium]|nr:hypothetical protein [Pseudobdellovibrionaceae bacterium]
MRGQAVLFLAFVLAGPSARAAACCGPSASLPSLLTSGERWKLQGGLSQTTAIADVGTNGEAVFRRPGDRRSMSLMSLEVAGEIRESWQAGITASRSPRDGRAGDLSLQVMHEALPETDGPRGLMRAFVFLQATFPTGRALEELQSPEEDPTGEGRGSVALGAVGIRRGWSDDQFVSARLRRFSSRVFSEGTGISSSWKADLAAGTGRTWGAWRGGVSVRAEHEGARDVMSGGVPGQAAENYRFPVGFSGSYFFKGGAMAQLQYTDDTLLGPVRNILLGRGFALVFAQRFY